MIMKENGGWMQDLTSIFSYLRVGIKNIEMYNHIDKLKTMMRNGANYGKAKGHNITIQYKLVNCFDCYAYYYSLFQRETIGANDSRGRT